MCVQKTKLEWGERLQGNIDDCGVGIKERMYWCRGNVTIRLRSGQSCDLLIVPALTNQIAWNHLIALSTRIAIHGLHMPLSHMLSPISISITTILPQHLPILPTINGKYLPSNVTTPRLADEEHHTFCDRLNGYRLAKSGSGSTINMQD
jgi:hypothetical protein